MAAGSEGGTVKTLRMIWRELADFMGWSVPAEVEDGYPTNLADYKERKRINEEMARNANGGRAS
jgi:hypothetical protein